MIEAGNWQANLLDIANTGADTMAQFLHYYGVDGLGYNSEFSNGYQVQQKLIPYHVALVKKMKGDYMEAGTYIYIMTTCSATRTSSSPAKPSRCPS